MDQKTSDERSSLKSNKSKQIQQTQKSKTSHILINLLLVCAVVLVLFVSNAIQEELEKTEVLLKKQQHEKSIKQATHKDVSKQKKKKNVMCPSAVQDLLSCEQKLQKCQKTQKQFNAAEKEFVQLIKNCDVTNNKNQMANKKMQQDIIQMEQTLKNLQPKVK